MEQRCGRAGARWPISATSSARWPASSARSLLLAVLARTVGLGGAGWLVGLASGLTLNAGARARTLARSVGEARPGGLGDADPRDARGRRRGSDSGLVRARTWRWRRWWRSRPWRSRSTSSTAGSRGARGRSRRSGRSWTARSTRSSSSCSASRSPRPPAPGCSLIGLARYAVPRGGMGASVDARASAAARLAQDGDGVAGGRAGDRGLRGSAVGGEPRILLAVALAMLAESFGRDVWWLWRHRASRPAAVCRGPRPPSGGHGRAHAASHCWSSGPLSCRRSGRGCSRPAPSCGFRSKVLSWSAWPSPCRPALGASCPG